MSIETLKARLSGTLDVLSPSLVPNIINDSLLEIYSLNDWGFLRRQDFIRTPAMIYQGSAAVAKYSNQVTLDAVASAQVAALTPDDISLIERQFRTFTPKITGRAWLYNIIAYDASDPNAVVLTIDPYFLDDSNAAVRFQILKVYYNPPAVIVNDVPIIDFNGWDYFISLKLQRKLHTDTTLEELNNFDPARFHVDEPRHVVPHPFNDDGSPLFELYPAPRFERVYRVIYRREGKSLLLFDDEGKDVLNDEDKLPGVFTEKFILDYSKYKLYEHAVANSDKYNLKSVGKYMNLMALLMNKNDQMSIPNQLDRLMKKDEENYPKAYLGDYMHMSYADSLMTNFTYGRELSPSDYGVTNTTIISF